MKIINLEKNIDSFQLKIECLDIEKEKIHAIKGHNGCGKTVLLKLIMGIMTPDSGRIEYEGLEKNQITLMSQRPYLLHKNVYENLIYPLKIRGIVPDETKMDALLERVGLLHLKKQYARSLSSGERQKLSFLRGIVYDPEFVMMDETLSNLDPESEQQIINVIKEIQETKPKTWLIVSHQIEQHPNFCDVIHTMEKGKYCGTVESGYHRRDFR